MAHDEGLVPLVLGQQGLKRLQVPGQFLQLVLLACLVAGVDEGDVFGAEILHTVIHHVHQGHLLLVLPI